MSDDLTQQLRGPALGDRPTGLPAGTRIGPWRTVRPLASGGFATVYEVSRADSGQRAALKLLHARLASSPSLRARFEREIRVLQSLQHPNIVTLLEAGFHDSQPYLCMELVDGEDLTTHLARVGRRSPQQAVELLEPLCAALATAHDRGVVHRDLKSANVMVGFDGRVVLLDFGIAKLSDAMAPELTASNQALGTPVAMAPEQIAGAPVDRRTDIYALGTLLFQLLTGQLPFVDPSSQMIQYLHQHARRPQASRIAGVSAQLDDVIVRAMAIDPVDRFPDAQAMLVAAREAVCDPTGAQIRIRDDAVAVLVEVTDRDGGGTEDLALFTDLEAVLPLAERFLTAQEFVLAADLGSSSVFVARQSDVADPIAVGRALWDALAGRAGRDPRVAVRVWLHRDRGVFVGDRVDSALLQLSSWHLGDAIEGLWVTHTFGTARKLAG